MSDANIFETLGFGPEEAANLRLRARLMLAIRRHLAANGMTQTSAAAAIGCSQSRISDIATGKIDRFTIDFLVNALAALGIRVDLRVGDGEEALGAA